MRLDKPGYQFGLFMAALGLMLSSSQLRADDYLSAIEAESGKVENSQLDEAEQGVVETTDAGVDAGAREEFEAILAERYHGSYTFYTKLPERSRQEIVQEYQRGASFVVLRKKIVDRFMQR